MKKIGVYYHNLNRTKKFLIVAGIALLMNLSSYLIFGAILYLATGISH